MKTLLILLALIVLPGCSILESRKYLHAMDNDPDCSYKNKPVEYTLPRKCGEFRNWGMAPYPRIIRTSPTTAVIVK
jgi:hypothetical protein